MRLQAVKQLVIQTPNFKRGACGGVRDSEDEGPHKALRCLALVRMVLAPTLPSRAQDFNQWLSTGLSGAASPYPTPCCAVHPLVPTLPPTSLEL